MEALEAALLEILAAIEADDQTLDAAWLDKLVRRHNRAAHEGRRTVAKRRLLPFYLRIRAQEPERWRSWQVSPEAEERLLRLLKVKPRRTASGVATITVITKPWPCSSACTYCPSEVRMPKSYLASEPACQRAEANFFDPYLQVKARLHALEEMGHVTDKVELIVLGGTWNDYPEDYRRWFMHELFRAVSDEERYAGGPEVLEEDGGFAAAAEHGEGPMDVEALEPGEATQDTVAARTRRYRTAGFGAAEGELADEQRRLQALVDAGQTSYNEAIGCLRALAPWRSIEHIQHASWEDVERAQLANEQAKRRVVGLVIETRPDLITPAEALAMRRLGCTKIQMGIQSLSDDILASNGRRASVAQIAQAFGVLRAFGFKTHVHLMLNLIGATPDSDTADYLRLVGDGRFCPDEIKLYPCALVQSSRLMEAYVQRRWQPYPESELIDLLVADVLATPAYVRISRMIRDIPNTDIVAGSKRTNLRQMVEGRLEGRRDEVREIRMREVATRDVGLDALRLDCVSYATAATEERFLQWVGPEGEIAGFCRLSLPDEAATHKMLGGFELPLPPATAMIREVHVYGRVAGLGVSERGAAQHAGLGRALVDEACRIAQEHGFAQVAVISAVGTRPYYRKLDFEDAGLYQLRKL